VDRGLIISEDVKEEELADSYLCSHCQPLKLLRGSQGTGIAAHNFHGSNYSLISIGT